MSTLIRRTARTTPFVGLVTALLTLLAAPLADAAALCDDQWSVQQGPRDVHVLGLAANGTGEAWAVGQGTSGPAVAQFASGRWRTRQLDLPGVLHDVASRPGAVWAIGSSDRQPLVVVRREGGWRTVDVAPPGSRLTDVAVNAPDDVWISGTTGESWDPQARGFVLQYDRGTWRTHLLPPQTQVGGLGTRSRDNTWAVGASYATDEEGEAAAWQWDGTRWTTRLLPGAGYSPRLGEVEAGARGQAWVIGLSDVGNCCNYAGIVARWTPDGWQRISLSQPTPPTCDGYCSWRQPYDFLVDRGTGTLTIVGSWFAGDGGGGNDVPVFDRWDGERWTTVPVRGYERPPGTDAGWRQIDGDGRGGGWGVGWRGSEQVFVRRCT